jgi:hypothetical protein
MPPGFKRLVLGFLVCFFFFKACDMFSLGSSNYIRPSAVACTYNPSYSGVRNWEAPGSRPAKAKNELVDPHLNQ